MLLPDQPGLLCAYIEAPGSPSFFFLFMGSFVAYIQLPESGHKKTDMPSDTPVRFEVYY